MGNFQTSTKDSTGSGGFVCSWVTISPLLYDICLQTMATRKKSSRSSQNWEFWLHPGRNSGPNIPSVGHCHVGDVDHIGVVLVFLLGKTNKSFSENEQPIMISYMSN